MKTTKHSVMFILLVCLGLVLLTLAAEPALAQQPELLRPSPWSGFPHGGLTGGYVTAIAAVGNDVYIGGGFSETADGSTTELNRIAKFSNGQWSALPNEGLNGVVNALAVIGDDLYVGGAFSATADGAVQNLNQIAKFSNGVWSALPNEGLGCGRQVYALAAHEGDLYVGGNFGCSGDSSIKNLRHIAKFSNGAWSALPNNGLNSDVRAMRWLKNDLYVGGWFSGTYDGQVGGMAYFGKLQGGTTWHPVANGGLNNPVTSLTVYKQHLVIGGGFTESFDKEVFGLNYIAMYDGNKFSRFPNGGLNKLVQSLFAYEGILYVGGDFKSTFDGTYSLNKIAKFYNNKWTPMPNEGLDGNVEAFGLLGGTMFVGGGFQQTADQQVTGLRFIARFNLGANLLMTHTVSVGPGPNEYTAHITVKNRGPNPADNIQVVDTVPAPYKPITATTDKGTCEIKKQRASCTVGTLSTDAIVNLVVTFRSDSGFVERENCAQVNTSTYDPNNNNNNKCVLLPRP